MRSILLLLSATQTAARPRPLDGKVAAVTGGSKGLGRARRPRGERVARARCERDANATRLDAKKERSRGERGRRDRPPRRPSPRPAPQLRVRDTQRRSRRIARAANASPRRERVRREHRSTSQAIVEELLAQGCTVVACARDASPLRELEGCEAVDADVRTEDGRRALVDAVAGPGGTQNGALEMPVVRGAGGALNLLLNLLSKFRRRSRPVSTERGVRLHGLSISRPRRRRDSSPRTIHLAAAATRLHGLSISRPRRRRDPSARYIRVARRFSARAVEIRGRPDAVGPPRRSPRRAASTSS